MTIGYVQIWKFCELTGYTEQAVRAKIQRGVWLENRVWRKAPDGHVLIHMEGFCAWVETGMVNKREDAIELGSLGTVVRNLLYLPTTCKPRAPGAVTLLYRSESEPTGKGKMNNDKEPPPEDFPIDGEMVGIGPDHQFGIRARLRQICSDANGGSDDAMIALLQFAQRVSAEIDIDKETSLDRIALGSLKKLLGHLLSDEKAMLAAFGVIRNPNRPESKRTRQRHILIVKEVGRILADCDTGTNAERTAAVSRAIEEAAEVLCVDVRTAQRAYGKYKAVAEIAEIMERNSAQFQRH